MGDIQQANEIVLRPSHRRYREWVSKPGALGIGLVVLAVGSSLRRAESTAEVVFVACLVVGSAAAALGAVAISMRTSHVLLAPSRILHRRWWVRSTSLDLDHGVVGVLAPHVVPVSGRQASQLLVLRGKDGGPRIRLNGGYWSTEDLETIARHAGVEPTAETLTTQGFESRVPHLMYWRDRHWLAFGVGIAVVLVAAIVGGVIGWFVVNGQPPFDKQPPRAVSGETVRQQDAVTKDLLAVIDVEWGPVEQRFRECQDDDDYKGWQRSIRVEALRPDDDPAPGELQRTPALDARIESAMTQNGYTEVGEAPYDEGELIGYSDEKTFSAERSVQVRIEGTRSQIMVDAGCEVPGR